MAAVKYATEMEFIVPRMHSMVVNQSAMTSGRKIKVHAIDGFPDLHIDVVLGWSRQAIKECWNEMVEDEGCSAQLGHKWHHQRTRIPDVWASKLNAKEVADDGP